MPTNDALAADTPPASREISAEVSSRVDAIWRIRPEDEPLVQGSADGPLTGQRVAVKDLFAVAGQRIGGGNPHWLESASVEPAHAAAVASLLDAGADVAGIAHTDELAFSLAGTNIHYGTPTNPAAPGRITGGSSSGPAAAVASGAADIGLGTDTGGSIRVPSSYCGLYGLRTTHGAVDRSGLLPLAPSFDTVGVMTRTASELGHAAHVLLPPADQEPVRDCLVAPSLMELATPETRLAVQTALHTLARRASCDVHAIDLTTETLSTWFAAFRTVQTAEAWRQHRDFITAHGGTMEPAVEARFRSGAEVSAAEEDDARAMLADAREQLRVLLSEGTALALPSASSPAPPVDADPAAIDITRAAALQLTCLAGVGGLPAVNVPTVQTDGLPVGLCLVGRPGADRSLLSLLEAL
ncbi:amidase [Phytoactinopolyspora endophytica]|uniref:amidase n=1 Tax=Phytoactinopolyspora endophytica TaxID=1642495 RepID=UPI00101E1318|nr:amidase [Phytoactinopolyspora endophytica]